MYPAVSRLRASGRTAKIKLWLVTWTACTAMSRMTMPTAKAASDDSVKVMGSQETSKNNRAIPVVRCPSPRSASRPAPAAATAPTAPARPNAPMAVCDSDKGAELRGKTSEVQSVLNAVKIKNANTARMRRILS